MGEERKRAGKTGLKLKNKDITNFLFNMLFLMVLLLTASLLIFLDDVKKAKTCEKYGEVLEEAERCLPGRAAVLCYMPVAPPEEPEMEYYPVLVWYPEGESESDSGISDDIAADINLAI